LKKLDRFIIKSYIAPLALTFVIALFILLMQFVWKYVDDMVGKGFEWYVIGELLFYASATFVPLALPLAILLASLMTFGSLGENYELVAIKSSGISFRRAMMPLTILTISISLFAFYFSNNILPVANLKFGTLLYDVREKKPALNISEGIFYTDINGYVMRVGKKDKDGKTIRNVMIYDHTVGMGNINVTVAEKGFMETTPDKRYLIFKLFDGYNFYENVENHKNIDNRPFQRTKFQEEIMRIGLSDLSMQHSKEELFKDNYQMLNIKQLQEAEDTMNSQYQKRLRNFKETLMHNFYYYTLVDSATFGRDVDSNKLLNGEFLYHFDKKERVKHIDLALSTVRGVNELLGFTMTEFEGRGETIARHQIERHRKFTLSFACLLLFFIGAPLGAIIRKGGLGMPVVFATLFFILFHVISMTGEKLVRQSEMPAYEGMWLASYIFLPIGIILTYAATTDSPILSLDLWSRLFSRLLKLKPKKK
jgi:lipopolysaccharide export system permease protein